MIPSRPVVYHVTKKMVRELEEKVRRLQNDKLCWKPTSISQAEWDEANNRVGPLDMSGYCLYTSKNKENGETSNR